MSKREVLIGFGCFVLSTIITTSYFRIELDANKKITKRILSNAVKSMKTSRTMANSCSSAFALATNCVANLSTCNIQEESKKLDIFNRQKKLADQEINYLNQDMKEIIEQVKATQ